MMMQQKNVTGDGSIYFEPVVLKVSGYSQYRPESDVRFEDVPDFWALPEKYHGPNKPPLGTIARFHLKTKPKSGPNAKPGSMYRDVVKIEKADASEYTGAPAAPQAAYKDDYAPQPQQNGSGAPANHWDVRDQQIKLGMAFNNATQIVAACIQSGGNFMVDGGPISDLWLKWFSEASRGLPLTPAEAPESEGQASELTDDHDSPLVRAAKDMGAVKATTARPGLTSEDAVDAGEDRQELPW